MKVNILMEGGREVTGQVQAVLRKANIRDYDMEGLQIGQCFQPGDIIRAKVISVASDRRLVLST